ncbi:hypothetical protein IW150_006611, partial [Coemansia sp. RSA 2607]
MTAQPPPRTKHAAVVGSGLAGLTAAHFLQRGGWQVTLLEQGAAVGMDAASVTVDGARIDVPLRVFTPTYYPCLARMYAHLHVGVEAADYSLGVSHADTPVWSYTNVRVAGLSVPVPQGLLAATRAGAQRRTLTREWLRLLYAALLLQRSPLGLSSPALAHTTLEQYLKAHGYSERFGARVLVPFVAAVMTCSLSAAAQYPANVVLDFVGRVALGERVRRAAGGVQAVCRALAAGLRDIRLGARVVSVQPSSSDEHDDAAYVEVEQAGARSRLRVDAVVLATQADVAAQLLTSSARTPADGSPLAAMLRALRSVPYEDASVLTHHDASVMPRNVGHWNAVNLATHPGRARVTSTHWLHSVHPVCRPGVFQTVDPPQELQDVCGAARFRRALVTVESQALLDCLHAAQGAQGIWVVGTYAAPGLPLLEGCVRSAMEVVRALSDQPLPFTVPPLVRASTAAGAPRSEAVGLASGMARDGM